MCNERKKCSGDHSWKLLKEQTITVPEMSKIKKNITHRYQIQTFEAQLLFKLKWLKSKKINEKY